MTWEKVIDKDGMVSYIVNHLGVEFETTDFNKIVDITISELQYKDSLKG
jgi:hypothetical protein